MKRVLLLLLGILSFVNVNAKELETSTTKTYNYNRFDKAVTFIERGVQFHVFVNGDFEFNSPYRNNRYYDYNGERFTNRNLRVFRDYKGRITKIGSNRIRYDYRGNVTRIGNIRLYYRNGLLRRVGDLKISIPLAINEKGNVILLEDKITGEVSAENSSISYNEDIMSSYITSGKVIDRDDPVQVPIGNPVMLSIIGSLLVLIPSMIEHDGDIVIENGSLVSMVVIDDDHQRSLDKNLSIHNNSYIDSPHVNMHIKNHSGVKSHRVIKGKIIKHNKQ